MSETAEEMVDAGPEPTLEELYTPPTDDKPQEQAPEPEPEADADEPAAEPEPEPEQGPPSDPGKTVPLAGLLDERDKRKAAEAEANALREKLNKQEATEPPPSVFDDEDAAFQQRIEPIVGAFQTELVRSRFELSREMMLMAKDDFTEREGQFLELCRDQPELVTKLQQSSNPARFAYETAVKHEQLRAMDNIDEWRDKERARIRQELEAEMKGGQQQAEAEQQAKRKAASPSLASERSAGGTTEVITDDEPLDDVLGG